MFTKRKTNRSTKKLSINLQHRKLKLCKSSHQIPSPFTLSNCKTNIGSDYFSPSTSQISKPLTLCIQDHSLRTSLSKYPLHRRYNFFQGTDGVCEKNIIIISKIEDFHSQYQAICNDIFGTGESMEWILLSKALNSPHIQQQFNQKYQPITFLLLESLAEVANHINFDHTDQRKVSLEYFSRIINFEAYCNTFACIEEYGRKEISNFKGGNKQLWVIKAEDKELLKKTQRNYYYLSKFCQQKELIIIPTELSDSIFIVQNHYDLFINPSSLQLRQSNVSLKMIQKLMISQVHHRYCQKISQGFLKDQLIVCFIGFPDKIVKQFRKNITNIASFNQTTLPLNKSFIYIYYNQKNISYQLGIQFNKEAKIENQVFRIKSQCQAFRRLKKDYLQLSFNQAKLQIAILNMDIQYLINEIQILSGLKVTSLTNISDLSKFQRKPVLLLGIFQAKQKQRLKKFPHVSLIDIQECQNNSVIVHNQIVIKYKNILKLDESTSFLTVNPKVISFNIQLQQVLSDPIYIIKQLCQLNQTLAQLQQNCNHIILMHMNDFSEEIQKQIQQKQSSKKISFDVYLQMGKQFIWRNKSSKYNFIKREQLIDKIKSISQNSKTYFQHNLRMSIKLQSFCQDYDQKIYTEIKAFSQYIHEGCHSTPNLLDYHCSQLLVVVPKTLPFYNILHRFAQSYTLLVYNNLDQIRYLTRNLGKHYYAAVVMVQNQYLKNLEDQQNFEYIIGSQMGEKGVRQRIQAISQKYGIRGKQEERSTNTKSYQIVILYDHTDEKQTKLVKQMQFLFKKSKIIALPKQQFQSLRQQQKITQNVKYLELGVQTLISSLRIKNITDLLKVYMSPNNNGPRFSADSIIFSPKQLIIYSFYQKKRTKNFKGRLNSISLQKNLSPRNRSFKNRQLSNTTGLSIFESTSMNTSTKRQIFSNEKELLILSVTALNKGHYVILILTHRDYLQYIQHFSRNTSGILWIVLTSTPKLLLVQASHTVFCFEEELQYILGQISLKFSKIRQTKINPTYNSSQSFETSQIQTTSYNSWQTYVNKIQKSSSNVVVDMVEVDCLKKVTIEQIQKVLLFNKNQQSGLLLNNLQNTTIKYRDERKVETTENIIFLVHTHNRLFIQNCLNILEENNYTIVTFNSLFHLTKYVQVTKSLFILQKSDDVSLPGTIFIDSSDTATNFAGKLRLHIESVRKAN